MMYLIKDITKDFLGRQKTNVIKVCLTEDETLSWMADKRNLKLFKGDIKVERVIL